MFFLASKLLWFLTSPVSLLLVVALLAVWQGRSKSAILCLLGLLALGFAPIGAWMIEPLEDRFPAPAPDIAAPYGIIVLGGAIDDEMGQARGQVSLGEGAERLTQAVALSRRFPDARIVYTGGNNSLRGARFDEATDGRKLLISLGVDPQRITIETQSRNTDENARFTRDLVHPLADQRWLLITSAWHMPRSMGLFRKAGFSVEAFPVDYRSQGGLGDWQFNSAPLHGLRTFDVAAHEWAGLFAYRMSGRIDALFPAP
jgi:uncharacterized SAM-binding protein YcdF (DUF218 family)